MWRLEVGYRKMIWLELGEGGRGEGSRWWGGFWGEGWTGGWVGEDEGVDEVAKVIELDEMARMSKSVKLTHVYCLH